MMWRRGLFRLWVVVAIGWVATVATLSASSVISPYVGRITNDGFSLLGPSGVIRLPYNSKEYEAAIEAKRRGLVAEVSATIQNIEYRGIFLPSEDKSPALRDRVAALVADLEADYLKAVEKNRAENVWLAAQLALIPPIVALAVGTGLAWALSGFALKKDPT